MFRTQLKKRASVVTTFCDATQDVCGSDFRTYVVVVVVQRTLCLCAGITYILLNLTC